MQVFTVHQGRNLLESHGTAINRVFLLKTALSYNKILNKKKKMCYSLSFFGGGLEKRLKKKMTN